MEVRLMPIWGYVLIGLAIFIALLVLGNYLFWRKINVVCENCGHSYKPKFIKFLFGWHIGCLIRLNCPECKKSGTHEIEFNK